MATALNVQTITAAGTSITYTAADVNGNAFSNPDGRAWIKVNNASAGAITVTVKSITKCSQGFSHDVIVSVPASTIEDIGPLPSERFTDPTTGNVTVTYSSVTSVTAAAVRM